MKNNAYDELFAVEDKHWWYSGLHDLVSIYLKSMAFDNAHNLQILDAGCGTGGLLAKLSRQGHHVAGIDISEIALNYCQNRNIKSVSKADLNNFKPNSNFYDVIVSLDVLCHKWIINELEVLKNLASGLKKDGILILNYPAFDILARKHFEIVMGQRRYNKKRIKDLVEKANLIPIEIKYRLPHAFPVLLLKRFVDRLFKNQDINNSDKTDIAKISKLNGVLLKINQLENRLIAAGVSFPFGSSLFVVAKKK